MGGSPGRHAHPPASQPHHYGIPPFAEPSPSAPGCNRKRPKPRGSPLPCPHPGVLSPVPGGSGEGRPGPAREGTFDDAVGGGDAGVFPRHGPGPLGCRRRSDPLRSARPAGHRHADVAAAPPAVSAFPVRPPRPGLWARPASGCCSERAEPAAGHSAPPRLRASSGDAGVQEAARGSAASRARALPTSRRRVRSRGRPGASPGPPLAALQLGGTLAAQPRSPQQWPSWGPPRATRGA